MQALAVLTVLALNLDTGPFDQLSPRAYIALKDRSEGQAMVEYALILALVSVVAIGVLTTLGTDVNQTFQSIVDAF